MTPGERRRKKTGLLRTAVQAHRRRVRPFGGLGRAMQSGRRQIEGDAKDQSTTAIANPSRRV